MNARKQPAKPKQITLERTLRGSLDDIWNLWTTKDGIESWWGPDGFRVEVKALDLRPGGQLRYDMIAALPEHIDFMMKTFGKDRHPAQLTYQEVVPKQRLTWIHAADFIPGVEPYDVASSMELHPGPAGVRMTLTFDAMHDDLWTERATSGWNSELNKLARVLEKG